MVLAACHIHSDWSYDGRVSLGDLANRFARRGYRVLLMTEHDRGFTAGRLEQYRQACADASSEKILLVPGIEYSDGANIVHILTWGDVPFLGEGRPTTALLRELARTLAVAVFAHPSRKDAWQHFTPEWTQFLTGIEVWNRKTDGWAPSRTAPALLRHNHLRPFVGMDFHDQRQMFPLAMQLAVNSPITTSTMLEALRSGRCNPVAFGRMLDHTMHGFAGRGLRSLEVCRKALAACYRRWKVA